jgi:glycosyltransferase involved in cell wall biosynthesis
MADNAEGLTVILPVFNQEKTLANTVSSWIATLDSLRRPYELLVVDDGSIDGTKAQAEALAGRNYRIRVLAQPQQMGFGACLRLALAESKQPIVFYTSTDHAWHPADLTRMLKSLDFKDEYTGKQVEFVNGHRRGTAPPPFRKWMNRIYRGFIRIALGYLPEPPKGWLGKSENRFWWKCRILFGLRIGDINSKFKLFRKSILERIELQSNGEFIHAELLAKANFLGCMMDEIVLTDREPPKPAPDVRKEMWEVFNDPRFRSATTESKPVESPPPPTEPATASS